ncbi:galactoside alpha-(1,2)-fucosyltransferase 2-like [Amphibalanus amphitrite]|uniref:galactoside alpha-(1,2)-fucosyltransferase 2-like n=1 Tax=Amphibalanus amphitrite TaxID=1232801 RepID=UPI001C9119F5|nr:galactoside alpha-(1,2)-fucosyltransferase 2-like [Amphibalanus amphitrite]
MSVCRSSGQRLLLAVAAVLVLVLVLLVAQPRLGPVGSPRPAVGQWQMTVERTEVNAKDGAVAPAQPEAVPTQPEAVPTQPRAVAAQPDYAKDPEPRTAVNASAADSLRGACDRLRASVTGLAPDVRQVMRWVCEQVGGALPRELDTMGCNKAVMYHPIGRLGNLMGLYAIVYSFSRMYGTTGYVESHMWSTLHKYFPDISLQSAPNDTKWKDITYQQAPSKLECQPGEGTESRFYRITNYPDRNGIDVFHPFYDEIRREFRFSDALQKQAQEFLWHARGNRSSVTYIGFHVRRTDYQAYIKKQYNSTLPDDLYFNKTLTYYRQRFSDALFIVCSDDLNYVAKQMNAKQNDDIVIAGNRNIGDPGRDMALLSACNHSVVTVGTYGFWGAYLAGGTVLVPERQTHLSRGDRHAPLLEIQLAGATNWVPMRRR